MTTKKKKKMMYEGQEKYRKENQTVITLKFHNSLDEDILAFLKDQPSKLAVIRLALRDYIAANKEE